MSRKKIVVVKVKGGVVVEAEANIEGVDVIVKDYDDEKVGYFPATKVDIDVDRLLDFEV